MKGQELAQSLSKFVQMADIDAENVDTGFLTGHRINSLPKEQALFILMESRRIITQMVQQLNEATNGEVPTDVECGLLFQYVFDKVTEVTYKTIMDLDIDTQLDLAEVFEYYEPDLPTHIQLKLTNVVGKVARIHDKIIKFLDDNQSRSSDLLSWMLFYLMVSASIAIKFAQEIDPEDDTDMQKYLEL